MKINQKISNSTYNRTSTYNRNLRVIRLPTKVRSSYGQLAYFSDIFIFGKSENCIGKICQLIITWTNFSRQTNYSCLGSYYKYWSYHKYVLFEFFWLIFIYTYRTMAFLYFPLGEKLKKLKFSISFQIYVRVVRSQKSGL